MDEKVMVDGVKRVVSKLLARRKLKRSYEYEVQWEGQPSSSDYTAWLSRDRSACASFCPAFLYVVQASVGLYTHVIVACTHIRSPSCTTCTGLYEAVCSVLAFLGVFFCCHSVWSVCLYWPMACFLPRLMSVCLRRLEEMGFTKMVNEIDSKEAARLGLQTRPLTTAVIQKHLEDVGIEPEFGTHSRMRGLSGGQKVKVVLAAAMWNNPHILVLDEPTNYLDRESLGALAGAIRNYGGGCLMISHNSGETADGVAVL